MLGSKFFRQVDKLRGWREVVFISALVERGLPNYLLFVDIERKFKPKVLTGALDKLWTSVLEKTSQDWEQEIINVEQQNPDPEQFDMYGVLPASTCCDMLILALLARIRPDKRRALDAARLSLQVVQGFLELSEGENMDDDALVEMLDEHPLMQDELSFQAKLSKELQQLRGADYYALSGIRKRARNKGVSNIGISLETK